MENLDKIRKVKSVTIVGIILNILLAAAKFILGLMGRSQALIADGVHSLSDLGTDLMLLLGASYWSKPPDENHPYGHRRLEVMISFVIGLILMITAVGIMFRSLSTLRAGRTLQPHWITFWCAVFSIISKELYYRWSVRKGRNLSSALTANAWHHRTDALSSIPVAFAIAIARFYPAWSFIDSIGGFLVSVFVLSASVKILCPVMDEFCVKGLSEDQIEKIKKTVYATGGVTWVHNIRSRKMGGSVFIDLHIWVDGDIKVREGHKISENVKSSLLSECENIVDVVVHIEPDAGGRKRS